MKKITIIYVFIGIISCFICSVVTPPKFYPDENHHYFRVITLAQGVFFPNESYSPPHDLFWYGGFTIYPISNSQSGYKLVCVEKSHIQFMEGGLQLKDLWSNENSIDYSKKAFLYLESTKYYLFTGYAIPAFVYSIVTHFTKNLYLRLICTRFITGLIFITVIAICINRAKRYTMIVFAVATLPISTYLISSLAPDGILLTSSLLLFVLLINILENNASETVGNKILLVCLTMILAFTKAGYFCWSFAVWLLAIKNKRWITFASSISIVSIITFVIPYFLLSQLYPSTTSPEILKLSYYNGLELLCNPMLVCKKVGIFLIQDSLYIGKQLICTYAWTRFYLPDKIYILYIIVLWLSISYKEEKSGIEIGFSQKFITFGVLLIGICFILFAFLLIKDCSGICGVQGRYFLPYLPLAFLLLHSFINVKIVPQKLIFNLSLLGIILLNLFANGYLCYIFYYYWN